MGDSRWIELKVNGAEIMLVLFEQANHAPGQTPGVVFIADNVRATYQELSKGRRVHAAAKEGKRGEHAILKDSEGNLVLIGTA